MSREYPIGEGNPFHVLEEYWKFERLKDLPPHVLGGMNKRKRIVPYPEKMQVSEWERQEPSRSARVREAPVFEAIAQAMYGGFRKDKRQLCYGTNGDSLTSTLDLLDPNRGVAKEVKGIHLKNSLNLVDVQIAKYVILQAGGYFPSDLQIEFEVFRHNVSGLARIFMGDGLDGLIGQLVSHTKFHVSLPFSMIYHLFSSKCKYTGRHERSNSKVPEELMAGESWAEKAYTRFQGTGLDALIAEPEDTIREIGLSNRSYNVNRMRFPEHVQMMGEKQLTSIPSFPSLVITDTNPRRWKDMLSSINFDPLLKILYEQARIDVRSLKLPECVKIPKYIIEELEFADARRAKDLIVYREEEMKKRGLQNMFDDEVPF